MTGTATSFIFTQSGADVKAASGASFKQLPGVPPQRWRPRSRVATMSAVERPDAGHAYGDALLVRMAEPSLSPGQRAEIRARATEWHLPMTTYLAARFKGRGEPLDDLTQVAVIGLIHSIDRFDPFRGVPFASYAIPTIVGELKRHFRDTTWNIRVPRRLQEIRMQLSAATEDLAHLLHRTPTTLELATRLGVSSVEVSAAQLCESAYRPTSIQQPLTAADSEDRYLGDTLGGPDPAMAIVDIRETLRFRLAELPAREQRVISLRFFDELTQAQIASDIGVSQMQVSRLLTQSLTRLRQGISI